MLEDSALALTSFAASLAVLSVWVAALTGATLWLFKTHSLVIYRGLKQFLRQLRHRHFYRIGLDPRSKRVERLIQSESYRYIGSANWSDDSVPTSLPRWYPLTRLQTNTAEIGVLLPDLNDEEKTQAVREVDKLIPILERRLRFARRVVAAVWALVFCTLFAFDTLQLPTHIANGKPFWLSDSIIGQSIPALLASLDWNTIVGLGLSVALVTAVASLLVDRLARLFDQQSLLQPYDRITAIAPSEPLPTDKIGRDGCAIRTLAFSGGAFDTIMQLGVAHALCVTQARPPDAVVGLSAGAIHAVALAEIIQAGGHEERSRIQSALNLDDKDEVTAEMQGDWWNNRLSDADRQKWQMARMLARSDKLRFFIEFAQRAPEQLLDALMPGSYQPYSYHPLQPLRQPRFSRDERDEKEEAIIARSGLMRLYNDLLNIPLSVATMTRIVRRLLGFMAAGEIQNWVAKRFVQASELLRIWILFGSRLTRFAPTVVMLSRGLRSPGTFTASAGTLIFRSLTLSKIAQGLQSAIAFVALLHLWAAVSWLLPTLILLAFGVDTWSGALPVFGAYVGALFVVLSFGQQISPGERERLLMAMSAAAKDTLLFLWFALLWAGLLLLLYAMVTFIIEPPGYGLPWVTGMSAADWRVVLSYLGVVALLVLLGVVVLVINIRNHPDTLANRLLHSYSLGRSILTTHEIREFLKTLFDPDYHWLPDMDRVVEASLNNRRSVQRPHGNRDDTTKTLASYSDGSRLERIFVGTAAADTATGQLNVLPETTSVIDALLAATSYTPFFPPVEIEGVLYVDGTKITQEPTSALLRLLRNRANENSKILHIYNVVPFPMSAPEFGLTPARTFDKRARPTQPFLNLVNVVIRALRLRRYRDATIERRLTELYNRAIPADRFCVNVPSGDNGTTKQFFRAWVTPIEREHGESITARILSEKKESRRAAIAEVIADGCRAAMQVMVHESIEQAAKDPESGVFDEKHGHIAKCSKVVEHHIARRLGKQVDTPSTPTFPGSDPQFGPGLSEICRHCKLWQTDSAEHSAPIEAAHASQQAKHREVLKRSAGTAAEQGPQKAIKRVDEPNDTAAESTRVLKTFSRGSLRLSLDWQAPGPAWPHEREYTKETGLSADSHFVRKPSEEEQETLAALRALKASPGQDSTLQPWPRFADLDPGAPQEQPPDHATVSFLFGGGVFRGVYQLGVLSGLSQLGLKPHIVAGASVGSITAAMVADAFTREDGLPRRRRIARLAAVYLSIDRLILTDRFADFIRDFTLRAAETRFSIRQLDRLFRKYDYPAFREFDRNTRRVVAGIERLLYVHPFQLNELVRAIKGSKTRQVLRLLQDVSQQILDRSQVGTEALGSEPLQALIDEYVTDELRTRYPIGPTFDDFRENDGIQFLATTTNLTQGSLEFLGRRPAEIDSQDARAAILFEGLLASSAFPGVFRPRWSWEVYPGASSNDQYIDGGVMDNLPLDAIAEFLSGATQAKLIRGRPGNGRIPHLIVAASLEVNAKVYKLPSTRRDFGRSWLALSRRNKELRYNTKLDSYAMVQENLRAITDHLGHDKLYEETELMDLQVVSIKPDWLCGTFAFHPMLGFRRQRQKASIAHGCAGTLLTFARRREAHGSETLAAWGITDEQQIPEVTNWNDAFARLPLPKDDVQAGRCWLRDVVCPFSKPALQGSGCGAETMTANQPVPEDALPDTTIAEIAGIYQTCRQRATHLRRI